MKDCIESQISCLIPPEQTVWFLEARRVYLEGDIDLALRHDKKLLAWANAQEHPIGRVLAYRFVGLCHFRKESLDKSAEYLRTALDLAGQFSLKHQVFLCANHLGGTLRRQGKLLEAYDLLREHLKQATLPTYLHERARLYGNYGALLDQLGQRAAADDCYSRMEELCELLGNADRLANARGLAARSADLRKDSETALHKYNQERELANQSGNAARQIAATLHMARMSSKLERFNEDDLATWDDLHNTSKRRSRLRRNADSCGTRKDMAPTFLKP